MNFSERKGYKTTKVIQKDSIDDDLRNSIWNVYERVVSYHHAEHSFIVSFYEDHVKKTYSAIDLLSSKLYSVKQYFFEMKWYEAYDFIEFTSKHLKDKRFDSEINRILERELSAYRLVKGIITDITTEQEIDLLEKQLTDEDFPNVKAHLQRALELLSDRKTPDYRNSIKESISAVESIAREIANKPKATLGEALKEIEKKGEFHKALKEGFLKLYGYTSDANGIRHAMMDEPNLTADDAKFFLLVCTSFINYLKTKM